MKRMIVVGMQWGDEGKGKIIDLLSAKSDHIVRSQGGNNAGHTVFSDGAEYKFHLIPSGILYPKTHCLIAGGTVIDLPSLLAEIEQIARAGITPNGRLKISKYAHILLPIHREIDREIEGLKAGAKVGTTGKGIGPCYGDKSLRLGLRIGDLYPFERFRVKFREFLRIKNRVVGEGLIEAFLSEYEGIAARIAPFVGDVEALIHGAIDAGDKILFEGAHGSLLDLTYGTYPFVTSSSTLASGVCAAAAVGPMQIDGVLGVTKAYTTRVGSGPFPTELSEDERALFPSAVVAREIGTTTGRERRFGWLDLPLLRFTARANGLSALALTKLDILDKVQEIKVCTHYLLDGEKLTTPPVCAEDLARVVPVYETYPGWSCSTSKVRAFEELPKAAREYIEMIEKKLGVPAQIISVGPDRSESFFHGELSSSWGL